ncbi:MAG: DUF429 domain-containing protein [Acidimicrobiales bacterium]|nr:DUF429 domain-containing protein [Acidimicrobiales bacterium]
MGDVARPRVAGVDGCRGGWLVAESGPSGRGRLDVRVEPDLGEVAARLRRGELAAVGVDMPIGLPESGPRPADLAARAILGRRGVTVFPAPPRAVLGCTSHAAADRLARARTGRGLTLQSFHLLPRIRELDRLLGDDPSLDDQLVEVHPEVSFATLAGAALAPKRSAQGRRERLALVAGAFPGLAGRPPTTPRGARPDDVLDALAVLWSALRFHRGSHRTLGGRHDARGRPMRIVV